MTVKQAYEATLIELDKQSAPAVTLESFNYFINKAINQFVNKQYNVGVDTDQQRTDDIRVLKTSTLLKPVREPEDINKSVKNLLSLTDIDSNNLISKTGAADVNSIYGAAYEFYLPADYLHLLNCICIFEVKKRINCPYDVGNIVYKGATKLVADSWPLIIDNLYMRPSYKRPYYYINNLNTSQYNPTNPITKNQTLGSIQYTGTDVNTEEQVETRPNFLDSDKTSLGNPNTIYSDVNNIKKDDVLNRKIKININNTESDDSTVIKTAGHRYGNASNTRLEIRYGQDTSVFKLLGIQIDYIKAPQYIRFTKDQLDLTEDTSQTLEFPDYICQEIVNELVKLIMENASDPRMQTQPAVSMSIAAPAQAQQTTSKK